MGSIGEDYAEWKRRAEAAATAAPEPTTAEAFATVRKDLDTCNEPHLDADTSLSLLERRMGAMALAARTVLGSGAWAPGFDALQSALADAPPVFTLEEVKRATEKPNWHRDAPDRSEEYRDGYEAALSDVHARLAALRRTS